MEKKKSVLQLATETGKLIEHWENIGNTADHYKNVFEDLVSTIERNAVDGKVNIQNVELWAREWRNEFYIKNK